MSSAKPPGCFQIDDTLFMDRNELTNLDWREYLYWIEQVHGKNSTEYSNALPDSSQWDVFFKRGFKIREYMMTWETYASFPLVGVSIQQAQEYAEWRSDRVAQKMLIEAGYLEPNTDGESNYFSIDRLRSGKVQLLKPLPKQIKYPKYRLATLAEFDRAVSGYSGVFNKRKFVCMNETQVKRSPATRKHGCITGQTELKWSVYRYVKDYYVEWINADQVVHRSWFNEGQKDIKSAVRKPGGKGLYGFRNACQWEYVFAQT